MCMHNDDRHVSTRPGTDLNAWWYRGSTFHAHLETWDLSRKCEGCLKPANRRKRIQNFCSDLSRLLGLDRLVQLEGHFHPQARKGKGQIPLLGLTVQELSQ